MKIIHDCRAKTNDVKYDQLSQKLSDLQDLFNDAFRDEYQLLDVIGASLPIIWTESDGLGGEPVTNPLTIQFYCGYDFDLVARITLQEMITELLEGLISPRTNRFGGEAESILSGFASGLRDEASRIEHAIEHGLSR